MVRRWTFINDLNFFEQNIFLFKRKHKLSILKKTLILRRFMKKYTKFRRRSFKRLKHKTTWFIYHNVFKYWIKDFKKNKYLIKNQHVDGLFLNNFFFFHKNFFKNKNIINENFSHYFATFSKKTLFPFFYNYLSSINNKKNTTFLNFFFFFNYTNVTQIWSKKNYSDSVLSFNKNDVIITYSEWEKQLFPCINTNYLLIKLTLNNLFLFYNQLLLKFLYKLKLFYIVSTYLLI